MCGGAEESTQQQHEADKQQALDNRLLEKQPVKPGNTRLKNLKH